MVRKYTHVKELEPIIQAMRGEGKSRREICEQFGLEMKQYENLIMRSNGRAKAIAAGETPKPKGRPRKDGTPPQQREQSELKRLRMENRLLRDFLQAIGRR